MSTLLGKYRLEQRLGGGGMAEVFLASTVGAEGFSRRVAIKRVLPGFSENPAFAKMFIDEARISSHLVHPNIVSVVDFDRDADGRLYLVMELIEGRDLDGLASTGPLPIPVVIYVISEVLRGLGHAHDLPYVEGGRQGPSTTLTNMRGIVHRDVSPHNVLLSWEGAVKVSDFGIAKARSASQATASEFIKGKPAYMSPEQANGEQLDGRSDLFAVGVMMWELLVGRRLFVGQDTRTTLAAVLFGQIPRPRTLRSDIPKDVEKVVMKLLERELPARYATAEMAITDLMKCDAAPRDGRELLKRALADRFPQQAPVRHSVMRSRSNSPSAGAPSHAAQTVPGHTPAGTPLQPVPLHLQPTQPPAHAVQTIADGAIGRPAPQAALGSVADLRTGTMPPGRPAAQPLAAHRLKRRRAVFVASALAVGAATFWIIAFVVYRRKTPIIAQGSGSATVAAAAAPNVVDAAPPEPLVDAPLPLPDAAESPVDAGTVDAPVPDAKKDATTTRPGEKRGTGRLVVKAFPVLTVYVDAKPGRDTPLDIPLPSGKHKLRLVNSEGKSEVLTVTIEDNKPTVIDRN